MKKIYVGNIPYNATEEDLRELFYECGEVESVMTRWSSTDNHKKSL